jgi:DNA-directed RNA polymerase specialized sigma subunit
MVNLPQAPRDVDDDIDKIHRALARLTGLPSNTTIEEIEYRLGMQGDHVRNVMQVGQPEELMEMRRWFRDYMHPDRVRERETQRKWLETRMNSDNSKGTLYTVSLGAFVAAVVTGVIGLCTGALHWLWPHLLGLPS